MRPAHRGFTIVELFVVVIAIGFLTAMALPHFGSAQRDQRIAKLNGARSAVQSAAALMHGVALSRHNQPQSPCIGVGFGANPPLVNVAGNGNLCTENGRVQVTRLYPAPTVAGIVASAGLVPVPGTPTAHQLGHEGFEVVSSGDLLRIQVAGGTDPARCMFAYTAPASLGKTPTITESVTSGC